jgi:hypothetical protein
MPCALGACARPAGREEAAPPRRRTDGPRWIAFSGGDPSSRGWTKEGALWIESEHVEAFRRGLLFDGTRYVPVDEMDRRDAGPESGYRLRTDHLSVATNVAFRRAVSLATALESHVAAVLAAFGDALDLRLPADPLRLVVAARRPELRRLLRERAGTGERPERADWNAWYDASSGTVYACGEPPERGGLPLLADARHETTHAILDLGRSSPAREAMFRRPQFWAWEASAIWSESFGDPPDRPENAERLARFRRRLAWGQTTPLAELLAFAQDDLQGRHYDQIAAFTAWLLATEGGRRMPGFLALLARVMDGAADVGDFERLVGLSPAAADAAFTASGGGK